MLHPSLLQASLQVDRQGNLTRFVAGFARIQYVLNSGESSYGCFIPPLAQKAPFHAD